MSQNPASTRPVPAPSRVSGGLPWWLWVVIVGFGLFVAVILVRKAIPEDPNLIVDEGNAALEKSDVAGVEKAVQKLKQFPEFAAQQKLMEGMLYLGRSKPLLAIPFLKEASEDPKLRIKALTQLGSAMLKSRQRTECLEVFETVIKEDESADDARLSIAYLMKEMISWDEALVQLEILKDRGFQPGTVHQLIGDIYFETSRFADASIEYKASIDADPTNPANGQKAARLMKCKIETHDLADVEEYAMMVDSPGIREGVRALVYVKDGEINEALATLDHVMHESPNDPGANLVYAEVMAGLDSKERAEEALSHLKGPVNLMPRNRQMFEWIAKLAAIAEQPVLAATARKNADQLKEQEVAFKAKLGEVMKTRTGARERLDLGDLAANCGQLELARTIYLSAALIDPSMETAAQEKVTALYTPQEILVPLQDSAQTAPTDSTSADPGSNNDSAAASDSKTDADPKDATANEESGKDSSPKETPSAESTTSDGDPAPDAVNGEASETNR